MRLLKSYTFLLSVTLALLTIVLWCEPIVFVDAPVRDEGVTLPILMYHHVLKDPARLGDYVVSPYELEADFRYLKEEGYNSVSVDQITAYVQNGTPLPEKPILITFDDGHLSFYEYALPLLEAYDLHAVLSVIGVHSDTYTETPDPNVSYAHVTWDDIKKLHESGRVDIENHSYDLHTTDSRLGTKQKKGENDEIYQAMLKSDLTQTQKRIQTATGRKSVCFTYPFGFISKTAQPVLDEMGFLMSLSCRERLNHITRDPACLFNLGRYNRPHGTSAAAILARAK